MPQAGRDYSVSDMTSVISTEALTLTPEPPHSQATLTPTPSLDQDLPPTLTPPRPSPRRNKRGGPGGNSLDDGDEMA